MWVESNFDAWLTDEHGRVVPGSLRRGHNVFTDFGREWLRRLVVLSTIGDLSSIDDAPLDDRRLRWIGVGSGFQLEITSVEGILTPLSITTAPDTYLRELGTRTSPTNTSMKFATAFTGASADFDHHGASVDVSEAGIFVDVDDGGGPELDPTVATHMPVAYKSFTPLTKLAAQTLTITWEFRF